MAHVPQYKGKSEDNFWQLVLSWHMNSRDWLQIVRIVSKHHYLLSYLASLQLCFMKVVLYLNESPLLLLFFLLNDRFLPM